MTLRKAPTQATLSPECFARIEIEGLSEDELRGALYALEVIHKLARVAKPQFPAMEGTDIQIPLPKVLETQADMAIGLVKATQLSLRRTIDEGSGLHHSLLT